MKTLKQLVSETPVSVDACPMWIKDATPETAFRDLAEHYLTEYQAYLEKERKSFSDLIKGNDEKMSEYRKKIDYIQVLDTAGMVQTLQDDVTVNGDILKKVIKERGEYLTYLTKLLGDTKSRSEGAPGLLKEVCDLFKGFVPNQITTTNEALKRFKSQYKSLLRPANLPEPVLRERIGAKRDLLAHDLGILEAENETAKQTLDNINKKLEEIDKIRKNNLQTI